MNEEEKNGSEIMNNENQETNYTDYNYDQYAQYGYPVPKKSNKILIIIIAILLVTVGAGGTYLYIYTNSDALTKVVTEVVETTNVTVTDTGIADAVEKVYDSVVVVYNYQNGSAYSSGSGFVYKVDGDTAYILTNYHVIEDASQVYVEFTDGSIVEVTVVGGDTYADVAVVSLPAENIISVAEIGSSEDARVGDTVFTVGAPYDPYTYAGTVTRGVVSGLERYLTVSTDSSSSADFVLKVIQTDAAINGGNSGGPLVNSNGEVIGINSAKLVSDGIEGMGFAIPIEDAIVYAEKFIAGEEIVRPYLGISMADLSTAQYYYPTAKNSGYTEGVFITDVESGSPADTAGLQKEDIIIAVNDNTVSSVAFFRYYLFMHEVGDTITLTVVRNGSEITITVNLTEANTNL